MLMLWWLAGAALVVALAAFWAARRTARRLDLLTQSYWELRYEFTRLRGSEVDPASPARSGDDGPMRIAPAAAPSTAPQTSFVSLSSLKTGDAGKAGQAGQAGKAGKAGQAGQAGQAGKAGE
jgi:hypothetical protein